MRQIGSNCQRNSFIGKVGLTSRHFDKIPLFRVPSLKVYRVYPEFDRSLNVAQRDQKVAALQE